MRTMRSWLTRTKKKKSAQTEHFRKVVNEANRRRCKILVKKKGKAITYTIKTGKQTGAHEPDTYFRAAWRSQPSAESAALSLGVARRSVVRMRQVMAQFILQYQLCLLDGLIGLATLHPPLFCITREAWDETGHVCGFRTEHDDPSTDSKARWEVMVVRVSICLGWDPRSGRQPVFYECVIPPVVIPTTSAASMHDSLRNHPSFMAFNRRLHTLRSQCAMQGYVMETDATYSNEKLIAFFMNIAPSTVDHLLAWKTCHSHTNMHVETMIMSAIDAKMVGSLYSMCSFLSSSSHWPRLLRSLAGWAKNAAAIVAYHEPPAASRNLAASIVSYFTWNDIPISETSGARQQRWKHAPPTGKASAAARKHLEWVDDLRKFLQCTYNNLSPSASVHCCAGNSCCPNGVASLVPRLEQGMRAFVCRRQPAPPVSGKWTKLAPALNAIGIGVLLRCWPTVWDAAFASLPCAQNSGEGVDDAEANRGAIDWKKVTGRRFRTTVNLINNKDKSIGLIILMICLEPVRCLTEYFIDCSSDLRSPAKAPAIFTLQHEPESCLTRAMQYVSFLYFEEYTGASRCNLLAGWLGFENKKALFAGAPINFLN